MTAVECAHRALSPKENRTLSFSGPLSQHAIAQFGANLRRYLDEHHVPRPLAMDVFSVFVEVSQNMQRYAVEHDYDDAAAAVILTVAPSPDEGHYMLTASNLVEHRDGQVLLQTIAQLGQLDPSQLRDLYRQRLHGPRNPQRPNSAGLGLLEITRRASQPPQATLIPRQGDKAFFQLSIAI